MRGPTPTVRLWAGAHNHSEPGPVRVGRFPPCRVFTPQQAWTAAGPPTASAPPMTSGACSSAGAAALWPLRGRGYITDQWHFLPVTAAALAVIARRGHLLVGGPAAAVV